MSAPSALRETELSLSEAPLDILDGDRGKAYPKKTELLPAGDCLFLNAKNVTGEGFAFDQCEFISRAKDAQLRKGKLQRHDVVLTTRGTLGNVALYGENVPFEHMRINSGMVILRCNRDVLDPRFLYAFLRSPLFGTQLHALRSGAAQPQFPIRDIRRVVMPVPQITTQRRIADLISAYDNLINNTKRRIWLLEDSIRLLYREWFVHLRFPGHERTQVRAGVPRGWRAGCLGELCRTLSDRVEPREVAPDYPYVGLEHIPRRSITLASWGCASDATSTKVRFSEGDVLFGKIRPYFHKVVVAPLDGVASSDTIVLRERDAVSRGLLIAVTSSDAFVEYSYQTGKVGSKMPRANWDTMKQYDVLVPPTEIGMQFTRFVDKVVGSTRCLLMTNQRLSKARDLLLPQLMNGSIAV